jgi:hypothetical protein
MFSATADRGRRTVTITLRGAEFSAMMAEMRTWLDQHMFKPEKFIYKQDEEMITISLDFYVMITRKHLKAILTVKKRTQTSC